ncbi:MAG: galactokinase [Pseudomonadota bacterium]
MTLSDGFRATFGAPPLITASAPGRVNLIGEHTDYNGGAVLPAALQCRVQVALAKTDTQIITLKSSRFEAQITRPAGDPKRGDWTDYAIGALNKAAQLGWLRGGVNVFIESDVPDGAGVSSSAALITAILRAAAIVGQVATTPVEIAKHARAVENDYISMPCGIMDQMAVGLADYGKALALDTSDLSYDVIDIPDDWGFTVLHSGVRRELADGRYKARFEECQQAAEALGTSKLCRLDQTQVQAMAALPEPLRKRARHVMTEHKRTVEASAAMKSGDLETFAALMNESHRSYSADFEASTPDIDDLVADALATGAKGARLTGGGFGGCIVVLHAQAELAAWRDVFLARHPKVSLV